MPKIILPMLMMLLSGLALRAGSMTFYWSGVAGRGFRAEAEWKRLQSEWELLVDKSNSNTREALRASNSFEKTANECLAMLKTR